MFSLNASNNKKNTYQDVDYSAKEWCVYGPGKKVLPGQITYKYMNKPIKIPNPLDDNDKKISLIDETYSGLCSIINNYIPKYNTSIYVQSGLKTTMPELIDFISKYTSLIVDGPKRELTDEEYLTTVVINIPSFLLKLKECTNFTKAHEIACIKALKKHTKSKVYYMKSYDRSYSASCSAFGDF